MKPNKYSYPKTLLKLLPLLVSTSILASFFINYPYTTLNLLDHALNKIGLIRLSTLPENSSPSVVFITPTPSPAQFLLKQKLGVAPTEINYYTGVEFWQKIQTYRRQHGVPEFKQDNVLCTIASIRVNQLLTLNDLDNHDGFSPLIDKFRENGQLTHHNVAENILSGYPTAKEAIDGWDSSLGHQALMQDGSYVYACTATNYGFTVLIAAY